MRYTLGSMNLKAHYYYRYRNILLLVASIAIAALIAHTPTFHSWVLSLGNFSYIGALIAGAFFTSTLTVTLSGFVLVELAHTLPAWQLGLIAAVGATFSDFTIFHIIKSHVSKEITSFYSIKIKRNNHLYRLLHTQYFSWFLVVIGAIIIASPLPDELGVSFLGLTNVKPYQVIVLSFISNFILVFSLALLAQAIH